MSLQQKTEEKGAAGEKSDKSAYPKTVDDHKLNDEDNPFSLYHLFLARINCTANSLPWISVIRLARSLDHAD